MGIHGNPWEFREIQRNPDGFQQETGNFGNLPEIQGGFPILGISYTFWTRGGPLALHHYNVWALGRWVWSGYVRLHMLMLGCVFNLQWQYSTSN